jgi:hypothetical protein
MASIRSQILAHIVAALNANGAPCTFFRCRQDEFQLTDLPAGNFFPTDQTDQIDAKEDDCILTVDIAAIVASAQDPVDDAADPLLVWIEQKIMADQTLGGLCTYIEPKGIKWFMENKGTEQCGAIRTFDIHFRTALTDTTANQS